MVQLTEQIIKGKTRLDKLEEVKNLNLWGQDLDDVSVLAKVPNLEVLSLSVNRLASLKDFRSCSKLQELYLRKNEVRDLGEIQHLAALKDLRVLWLSDNPCADHPQYKQFVARTLPQLQKLDNDDVSSIPSGPDMGGPPQPSARSSLATGLPPLAPPPLNNGMSAGGMGNGITSPYGTPYGDRAPSRGSPGFSPEAGGYGGPSSPHAPGGYGGGVGGYGGGYGMPGMGGVGDSRTAGLGPSGVGAGGRRGSKNVLYAVMALLGELDEEDLVYVRREVEQRLAGR